jgi:hypothetical protein
MLFPLFVTGVIETSGKKTRNKKKEKNPPKNIYKKKFAAGAVDTVGKLPPVILTPAANLPPVLLTPVENLPPVSTTLGKLVAKFSTGVIDTGGAP